MPNDYDAFYDQMEMAEINSGSYSGDVNPTLVCAATVMPDQFGDRHTSAMDITRLEVFGQVIPYSEIGPTLRAAILSHMLEFGEWHQ